MTNTRAAAFGVILVLAGCESIKRNAIKNEIAGALRELNDAPDVKLTELAPDLFTFKWYSYRTAFLTTPEGVIVFDPVNPTVAASLAAEIKRVAKNPTIRYVIYSHAHADHASGAAALGGAPVIVAHANAARDLARRPDPEIAPPTEVVEGDNHELTLGGATVQLIHVPGAHTDGMLVSYIPHRKALVEVDMAMVKMIPPVGAPYSSFHGQIEAIEKMQTLDYQIAIPGHGRVGTKQDVADYGMMLRDLEAALRRAAASNGVTKLHGDAAFFTHPKVGEILFTAKDSLESKYRSWQGWSYHSLQALQWAFFYGVYMHE